MVKTVTPTQLGRSHSHGRGGYPPHMVSYIKHDECDKYKIISYHRIDITKPNSAVNLIKLFCTWCQLYAVIDCQLYSHWLSTGSHSCIGCQCVFSVLFTESVRHQCQCPQFLHNCAYNPAQCVCVCIHNKTPKCIQHISTCIDRLIWYLNQPNMPMSKLKQIPL